MTNDDGIDAPGLDVLASILRPMGTVVVVAPATPQSWVSHRVTALSPIRVEAAGEHRFCVEGTPADCTRIALKTLVPDAAWLFSGINPGANLGSDVYNSGTVAAAREAAILGCPSAALSQYIARDCRIDWPVTAHHAGAVVRFLMDRPPAPGHFWNVNLPHPLVVDRPVDTRFCALDPHPHDYRFDRDGPFLIYRGSIHNRPRDPGKDVDVCFSGSIAVTRIAIGTTGYHPEDI